MMNDYNVLSIAEEEHIKRQIMSGMCTMNGDTDPITITARQAAILLYSYLNNCRPTASSDIYTLDSLESLRMFGLKDIAARSPHWENLRTWWLTSNNKCEACGTRTDLEVHHIYPVHLFPELELTVNNLITLCGGRRNCHLRIGHLFNWGAWNPDVVQDAAKSLVAIKNRQFTR